jgi:hypothetical protein
VLVAAAAAATLFFVTAAAIYPQSAFLTAATDLLLRRQQQTRFEPQMTLPTASQSVEREEKGVKAGCFNSEGALRVA